MVGEAVAGELPRQKSDPQPKELCAREMAAKWSTRLVELFTPLISSAPYGTEGKVWET